MKFVSLGSGLAVIVLPALVLAETHQIPVDPDHSQVGFQIRHLVSKVPGHFDEFSGTITIDPANVAETLKIEGTVQAASINTRNDKRDGHLRSEDFFAAEKYPEITFVSKSVTKDGDDYEVTGDLTMRGVTKQVVLEAEYGGVTTNPFTGTPTVGLSLEGEVNRKDFGIEWNKTLDAGGVMLGDEVDINIEIEATVPPPSEGEQS